MAETMTPASSPASTIKRVLVPVGILLLAVGIIVLVSTNWNSWVGGGDTQETDDAYVRADLTPLSTKVAGLVASVPISDYQPVKAGDLLVQLREDDFKAQVAQAVAAVASSEAGLVNNQRQRDLQDAHINEAGDGIRAAEADRAAAEAGIEQANSSVLNAQSGVDAAKADVERTTKERIRQEALIATESTTRQKLEQAVADERRYKAQLDSREAEVRSANAALSVRKADLAKAKAGVASKESEFVAQKRQKEVLISQQGMLRADLDAKKAALNSAQISLNYTKITAPEDGIVGELKVHPGQLVNPGTQVVSLVQKEVWIQANLRETQVRHLVSGDPADVRADAFPGVILKGKVAEVAPASGSQFALLPPDNATGNYTKVVQRVPVKIVFEPNQSMVTRLRPGLSVVVTVHATKNSQ